MPAHAASTPDTTTPSPTWSQAVAAADVPEGATLDGVLDRITYHNAENGYTIAKLKVARQREPITIAGNLPGVHVGETLRLVGKWTLHAQYGRQFTVTRYEVALPGTLPGLKKYLGSGLLKGVGPATAEQLVNTFGFDTIDVLERQPQRLREVPGLGGRKAATIVRAWQEQRALQGVMEFLQRHGLPSTLALRVIKYYGEAAASVVQAQPYRLTEDVYGVTFAQADGVAIKLGLGPDTPQRIWAGVKHTLGEAANDGHTWQRRAELVPAAARLLAQPAALVEAKDDRITVDLMKIPKIAENPRLKQILSVLTPVVGVRAIKTKDDHLDVHLKADLTGVPAAIAAARGGA